MLEPDNRQQKVQKIQGLQPRKLFHDLTPIKLKQFILQNKS